MFEFGARARAAMRHGAEGAERLRGEWLNAGREAYGEAARGGREVVARTETELEALGRKAMAEKARLKAVVRESADDAGRRVEAGRVQLDRAVAKAQQGLRNGANAMAEGAQHAGRATGRALDGMGGQVIASQPLEREIVRAMGPAARDLAGKAWNAPNTLVGLAYGGAGHVAGMATGTKPYVTTGANAIQFRNNPLGGVGAITLGNTTTYRKEPRIERRSGVSVQEHERQHTIQGEQLGPLYLPSNPIGGGLAVLRDGDWHGPANWNEWGPQQPSPQPWPSRRRP